MDIKTRKANEKVKIDKLIKDFDLDAQYYDRYLEALTTPAYRNEYADIDYDYQRLEWIGDAVIYFATSVHLYHTYEEATPGELTDLRKTRISAEYQTKICQKLNLMQYCLTGKGFANDEDSAKGIYADILESLVGAVYICEGHDRALEFVKKYFFGFID